MTISSRGPPSPEELQALVMLHAGAAVLIQVRAVRAGGTEQGYVIEGHADMFRE